MGKQGKEACPVRETKEIRVIWNEERRSLTLEGEPGLRYVLSWPQVEGAGLGGRWISRYYLRLAGSWPGKRLIPGWVLKAAYPFWAPAGL